MTQTATVKNLRHNGMATMQIARKTACGHDCSKCSGCTQVIIGETLVNVYNSLNAELGDEVLIESQSAQILKAAMMVYILPFALFFVGYAIIACLMPNAGGTLPVVGGLVGLFAGIVGAIMFDRREKKNKNLQFHMVEISKKCSDM